MGEELPRLAGLEGFEVWDGSRARQEVTRYNDEVHKLARRST